MKPGSEIQQNTTDTSEKKHSTTQLMPHFTPKWAVLIGILATGVIYLLLQDEMRIGPSWLLIVIEVIFLLPLVVAWLTDLHIPHATTRILILTLLGIITLALAIGIALLVVSLKRNTQGAILLQSAGLLWILNILVFGLWYWEIDGGGPVKRHMSGHQAADFMFPQQADGNKGGWVPHFIDYLFVAFTGATALSPTDTYPLTRKAKVLMMIEAVLSLVIVGLLAARAVNILQ